MSLVKSTVHTIVRRGLLVTVFAVTNHVVGLLYRAAGIRFRLKRVYTYKMLLDLEDRGISRTLLLFGERELEHKFMLDRVLKPGMTVLDIGANIGYYALMELSKIGLSGTLIAVEPSPSNIQLLKKNLTLNQYNDIEIHQGAVSDTVGTKKFFLSQMSNLNTFHTEGSGAKYLSGETVDVETFTVPSIMGGRNLDLIRMDVEGHEVEVLRGLLPAIESAELNPAIIFETHMSCYGSDHDIEEPLRRLYSLGYSAKLVGSSSDSGTRRLESMGYKKLKTLRSDGDTRAVFENILLEDLINLLLRTGGVRTVLLSR